LRIEQILFVTRKLSGSATTSKPCARSKRVTPLLILIAIAVIGWER
jgi:hypothetical protein